MIGTVFSFVDEVVEVRIDGNNCIFRTSDYGGAFVPIEYLKLSKDGVIKEHPDLKDREDWREEAIIRFKNHLKNFESEIESMNYVIEELKKCGYKPIATQRVGFRPIKYK